MSRQDLALEHLVLQNLKALPVGGQSLLAAVSGGLDSMVMAAVLQRWSRRLKFSLSVAHIHHGGSDDPAQLAFRREAQSLVRRWSQQHGLPFYTNRPALKKRLKTEQQWRELREARLRQWRQRAGSPWVALAHHREDLLETRLIRLIRGAGPQGLEAMSVQDDWKVRPLLSLSRRQLEDYARVRGLQWVEDPSNRNSDHLRNWLRAEWLPSLENQRPGAGRALARSLQELCTSGKDRALGQELGNFVGLRRDSLKHVNAHQRRALIARYFLALGVRNYGQTHIDEVVKRLSTRAKTSRFELLGFNWEITQDLLWASRV